MSVKRYGSGIAWRRSDAEAERIFSALAEGGEVFMPMQETFFATRFAQLRDRFGINWMIIHERPIPAQS